MPSSQVKILCQAKDSQLTALRMLLQYQTQRFVRSAGLFQNALLWGGANTSPIYSTGHWRTKFDYYLISGILIGRMVQFMDWIKNQLESWSVYCKMIMWLKKHGSGGMCGGNSLINLKGIYELHHHHHHHHNHNHHKHQGLDTLIRSVSRVTAARANASSVFQLFSLPMVCSGMISRDSAVWHPLQVWKPVPSVFIYIF